MTTGVGAAGIAVTDILLAAGARLVIGCDQGGSIHRERTGLDAQGGYAERTNPADERGSADELLAGADVFLGFSVPGAVTAAGRRADGRRRDRLRPREPHARDRAGGAPPGKVAVVATGRSDYPNQINNVLAFPGVFRGALDVRASRITEG